MKSAGAVVVVDGGDLFWKSRVLPAPREAQQLEKARLQASAYADVGLDAFVPGEGDFALGTENVWSLVDEMGLPVLAAGLVCGERSFPAHRVLERGGVRVGVIGVTSEVGEGCTAEDPVKAVRAAVEAQGEVDVRLVVAHTAGPETSRIGALESVDFVIDGHARKTWATPRQFGEEEAFELGAGSRGRRLGVLSLHLKTHAQGWSLAGEKPGHHGFTHHLVELDASVGEHSRTQEKVEAAKPRIGEAAGHGAPDELSPAVGSGPFVGTAACLACHPAQYAQWRTTQHAKAMDTLREVGRASDLDCFSCHVTGADHPQGPHHPAQVGILENVGCESCHGPGKAHVASPAASTIRKSVEASTCRSCHDGEKDGGRFDWDTYLPKVTH